MTKTEYESVMADAQGDADVMLGAGGFGLWPMMTSPATPSEHVKTLRSAFARATGTNYRTATW